MRKDITNPYNKSSHTKHNHQPQNPELTFLLVNKGMNGMIRLSASNTDNTVFFIFIDSEMFNCAQTLSRRCHLQTADHKHHIFQLMPTEQLHCSRWRLNYLLSGSLMVDKQEVELLSFTSVFPHSNTPARKNLDGTFPFPWHSDSYHQQSALVVCCRISFKNLHI